MSGIFSMLKLNPNEVLNYTDDSVIFCSFTQTLLIFSAGYA